MGRPKREGVSSLRDAWTVSSSTSRAFCSNGLKFKTTAATCSSKWARGKTALHDREVAFGDWRELGYTGAKPTPEIDAR
jgi:hypothetical protein